MKRRIVALMIMTAGCLTIFSHQLCQGRKGVVVSSSTTPLSGICVRVPDIDTYEASIIEADVEIVAEPAVVTADTIEEEFYDSLEYVAQCVEAEAGNQGYQGKVYVADCILNRLDSGKYDNYFQIINETNQFQCVSNGSINCVPSDETYEAVANELYNRTNSEILYFRTDHYHSFGTPCFVYKDHYFSK